jgi:hypothetical protein
MKTAIRILLNSIISALIAFLSAILMIDWTKAWKIALMIAGVSAVLKGLIEVQSSIRSNSAVAGKICKNKKGSSKITFGFI